MGCEERVGHEESVGREGSMGLRRVWSVVEESVECC